MVGAAQRWSSVGAAALVVVLGAAVALSGGPAQPVGVSLSAGTPGGPPWTAELPATVSNVTVTRDPDNPRVAQLAFDSEVLGLRAVNDVLLPAGYDDPGAGPVGTLYWLHGTRGYTALGDAAIGALPTPGPDAQVPGGAADAQGADAPAGVAAADGTESAPQEQFLRITLDAGPEGWCNSCWWVDGRDGQGVDAETHLLQELIPVVEATFDVRADRGRRAVAGSSMGGIGALVQAFRHPDVFAYVASQSGPPSAFEHDDVAQLHQDGLYYGTYLITQGYPDPVTDPNAYRNIDAVTLAPQVVGTGLEIVLWANDGCLPPYDPQPQPVGDPDCVSTGQLDPQHGFHMANEWGIRTDNEVLADRFLDLGVPFRLEVGHGRHGPSTLYRDHIIGDLNRLFATDGPATPSTFGFKTADRSFSVWGYDVEITDRPTEEFVHLLGARTDGLGFTIAGTGRAVVSTPPVIAPGADVAVRLIHENAPDEEVVVAADADGRVRLELALGDVQQLDQRQAASRQGLQHYPRTTVELRP